MIHMQSGIYNNVLICTGGKGNERNRDYVDESRYLWDKTPS